MDAQTCLEKLQYVGVLAFATVDEDGNPQVRNISAIHYEPCALLIIRRHIITHFKRLTERLPPKYAVAFLLREILDNILRSLFKWKGNCIRLCK